ncbi:MAG: Spermidine synthase [Syntrophorhabdus sp. PtaU1.Bin002]|nr:MAG: Spermidine synthase [Syntrophorhabdus sp. PtaU1.Bin002]
MVNPKGLRSLIFALFVTGIGGIVAQTILFREMLVIFSGNEFSIGVLVGFWIGWAAAGVFAGEKIGGRTGTLAWSLILFSLFFPASIYLIRIIKALVGIPPGMGAGIIEVISLSFLILLPVGFTHGFLFATAYSVYNKLTAHRRPSSGKVYCCAMVGTIVGGITLTYAIIPSYHAFQAAAGVVLLHGAACLFILLFSDGQRARTALVSALILFVGSVILLAGTGADRIQEETVREQWRGKKIISYMNSFYHNIVATGGENHSTFFLDGLAFLTTPTQDAVFAEEFVHFPLLAHPSPREILVLGRGAGGVIAELLKYQAITRIDYVETDPTFLRIVRNFVTPVTAGELTGNPVRLHYVDGMTFVRQTRNTYDVVLFGLPPPHTLEANRFFTREFFGALKGILKQDGILALTMTGSPAYSTGDLKDLNASMVRTLEMVFPYRFIIPGVPNLFMVSAGSDITRISPNLIHERLTDRAITTTLINQEYLDRRLQESRKNEFLSSVKGARATFNSDFSPRLIYYNLLYLNRSSSSLLNAWSGIFKRANVYTVAVCIIALFLFFLLLQRKYGTISLSFAMATTGFSSITLQLLLLCAFQIFYGRLFSEIGILITAFMAGIAGGCAATSAPSRNSRKDLASLKSMEIGIILLSIILFLLFRYLGAVPKTEPFSFLIVFIVFLLVLGFLAGMESTIANRIFLRKVDHFRLNADQTGKTAGFLCGANILGGWAGGILGGFVLVPTLGFVDVCLAVAILKLSSFLLLLTFPKK